MRDGVIGHNSMREFVNWMENWRYFVIWYYWRDRENSIIQARKREKWWLFARKRDKNMRRESWFACGTASICKFVPHKSSSDSAKRLASTAFQTLFNRSAVRQSLASEYARNSVFSCRCKLGVNSPRKSRTSPVVLLIEWMGNKLPSGHTTNLRRHHDVVDSSKNSSQILRNVTSIRRRRTT